MIGILAFGAIATLIAFFAAPSMPLYSAKDIQLKRFRFSFTELTASLEILAGVEIDNGNIVGGDLYSTLVDIYYPDWNGTLSSIGYLRETQRQDMMEHENNIVCKRDRATEGRKGGGGDEDDHGICIPSDKKYLKNPQPFFSVQSRGISTTEPGAITIYINRIPPRIYLNILKDIITSWGAMNLLVSGVAHVKSPLGLPLSLGVICNNYLDITKLPLQVVGKECIVERISTGWSGLEELALEVKERVLGYYVAKNGNIFGARSEESSRRQYPEQEKGTEVITPKSSMEQLFLSSEVILDWHDF
eukprot:CAMPEP_0176494650 /NCGR_PEP_ID=MMETSP0200_2-20121128/10221_1 /TAXON_ID=947934 /ORGANISM="Chaetoceros sp., Strain GSL56" /LENGTH=302 /DNA_ID=CAMNT_0017892445 /DNA_START=145 /DNA_END=1053 /DNA_ORIENTATION=+